MDYQCKDCNVRVTEMYVRWYHITDPSGNVSSASRPHCMRCKKPVEPITPLPGNNVDGRYLATCLVEVVARDDDLQSIKSWLDSINLTTEVAIWDTHNKSLLGYRVVKDGTAYWERTDVRILGQTRKW